MLAAYLTVAKGCIAPASGTTSVFVFYTQDGGTTYYGFVAGEGMA